MTTIEIEKALERHKLTRHRNWAKLVSRLKKQLDVQIEIVLKQKGYNHKFKHGYMPFLMNIDSEGITNNDLSKRFGVTKQATSKIVNELSELRYVAIVPHSEDGRSSVVFLTDRGKKFVLEAKSYMESIAKEYSELLGKKEYENLVDNLVKIVDHNEKKQFPIGSSSKI